MMINHKDFFPLLNVFKNQFPRKNRTQHPKAFTKPYVQKAYVQHYGCICIM